MRRALLAALGMTTACASDAPIDRTTKPALAEAPTLTFPPVIERKLSNGLRVLVVEHHELPLVDVIVVTRSGTEAEPADKAGLATLTAAMLDEGTAKRSALEIADQAAFLGIRLATGGGWDQSSVSLHTPTAQLDSALALMADVALRPSFPANELERLRKERLTQLIQLKDSGPAMASQAFASIVYGAAHPYGRLTVGNEAAVKAITREDLVRFYESHYRANNSAIIVVGDVTPADIERRLEAMFGSWQGGTIGAMLLPEAPVTAPTKVYLVDKPNAPQSSFRIGAIGVPRATPDFFPITVMNTLLGDAFTSRLNMNLREKRGYTYGAFSSFDMRRGAGPFAAQADVEASKTDSALIEFMNELNAIRDTVSQEELNKGKKYLALQLPSEFETTTDIAARLVPVVMYELPIDFYTTYSKRIAEVTQADVQRVARRYLDPLKMAVVIVGDRKTIEKGLRGLNFGGVEIRK